MHRTAGLTLLALVVVLTGCSDGTDSTFDLARLTPDAVCGEDGTLPRTHLRLKGLGTAAEAVLRPTGDPDAPGRTVRRWRSARLAGSFDVTIVPADDRREVDVSAQVLCGSTGWETWRARGPAVRVVVGPGAVTVSAVAAGG